MYVDSILTFFDGLIDRFSMLQDLYDSVHEPAPAVSVNEERGTRNTVFLHLFFLRAVQTLRIPIQKLSSEPSIFESLREFSRAMTSSRISRT